MKLLISGIVASGKTTLARELSAKFDIPHYEGDSIAWGFPGEERYKRTHEEQAAIIERINACENWIIEGTYRESQKILFEYADKVIFLDTPLAVRKFRIVSRFIKQKCGMEQCNYKPSWHMLKMMFKWTKDFEQQRATFEEFLMTYQDKLIWIRSPKELAGKL